MEISKMLHNLMAMVSTTAGVWIL